MHRLTRLVADFLIALITSTALSSCVYAQGQGDLFKQHHDLMVKAINDNQVERVKALLKTPYVLVNDPAYEGSYLSEAVVHDRPQIAQVLLDAGADVTWHNRGNGNLFHIATANQRAALMPILIDALRKSTGGVSSPEFKQIINMQEDVPAGATPLFSLIFWTGYAADQSKALILAQQLIETAGADPNIPERTGRTPLWEAKAKKLLSLAAYLQQHGAH